MNSAGSEVSMNDSSNLFVPLCCRRSVRDDDDDDQAALTFAAEKSEYNMRISAACEGICSSAARFDTTRVQITASSSIENSLI